MENEIMKKKVSNLLKDAAANFKEAEWYYNNDMYDECIDKSFYTIYFSVRAAAVIHQKDCENPLDLFHEIADLVDNDIIDEVFYYALVEAIGNAEMACNLEDDEVIHEKDVKDLLKYCTKVMRASKKLLIS